MKFLKLFENFETDKPKSKTQIKRELWRKNNPEPKGKICHIREMSKFDIPQSILEMMKKWPIIYKSPYSNSFYSSDQITWSGKPDKSYRVSDHWNFVTRNGPKIHCVTTDPVKDQTHCSIGQYDTKTGKYEILISELKPSVVGKKEIFQKKLIHLKDPETIYQKKLFKDRIKSGEVFAEFSIKGVNYKGRVEKYTGPGGTLRLVDDNGEIIYSSISFNSRDFRLFDKNDDPISNVYED